MMMSRESDDEVRRGSVWTVGTAAAFNFPVGRKNRHTSETSEDPPNKDTSLFLADSSLSHSPPLVFPGSGVLLSLSLSLGGGGRVTGGGGGGETGVPRWVNRVRHCRKIRTPLLEGHHRTEVKLRTLWIKDTSLKAHLVLPTTNVLPLNKEHCPCPQSLPYSEVWPYSSSRKRKLPMLTDGL